MNKTSLLFDLPPTNKLITICLLGNTQLLENALDEIPNTQNDIIMCMSTILAYKHYNLIKILFPKIHDSNIKSWYKLSATFIDMPYIDGEYEIMEYILDSLDSRGFNNIIRSIIFSLSNYNGARWKQYYDTYIKNGHSKTFKIACTKNNTTMIQYLIESNIDFNYDKIFYDAVASGISDVIQLVMNTDVNISDHYLDSFDFVLNTQNTKNIRLLYSMDRYIHLLNYERRLLAACILGDVTEVSELFLDAYKTSDSNYEVLITAIRRGDLPIVKFLIENYNPVSHYNDLICLALDTGHYSIVAYLLPLCQDLDPDTMMTSAYHLGMIDLFINTLNGNVSTKNVCDILKTAIIKGNHPFINLILQSSVKVYDDEEVIKLAVSSYNYDVLHHCIDNASDITNALKYVSFVESPDNILSMTKYLIDCGARINYTKDSNVRLINISGIKGKENEELNRMSYLEKLLVNMPDFSDDHLTDDKYKEELYLNIVKFMIENGAEVENDSNLLFRYVISKSAYQIIDYLLEKTNITINELDIATTVIALKSVHMLQYLANKGINIGDGDILYTSLILEKFDIYLYLLHNYKYSYDEYNFVLRFLLIYSCYTGGEKTIHDLNLIKPVLELGADIQLSEMELAALPVSIQELLRY